MPGTDRVIRDYRVAVLVSPKFGTGWTTWNRQYPDMLFDPGLVELIERDRRAEAWTYAELKWPGADFGALDSLTIEWVDEGWYFRVEEYDGMERVEYRDRIDWIQA